MRDRSVEFAKGQWEKKSFCDLLEEAVGKKEEVKSAGWRNGLICLSLQKRNSPSPSTEGEKRSRDQEGLSEVGARLCPSPQWDWQVARAGQGPMRRPEEGGWEGLSVRPPRSNRGQSALRAQAGPLPRRLLFFIFFLFILIIRVVHQTNQSSLKGKKEKYF